VHPQMAELNLDDRRDDEFLLQWCWLQRQRMIWRSSSPEPLPRFGLSRLLHPLLTTCDIFPCYSLLLHSSSLSCRIYLSSTYGICPIPGSSMPNISGKYDVKMCGRQPFKYHKFENCCFHPLLSILCSPTSPYLNRLSCHSFSYSAAAHADAFKPNGASHPQLFPSVYRPTKLFSVMTKYIMVSARE